MKEQYENFKEEDHNDDEGGGNSISFQMSYRSDHETKKQKASHYRSVPGTKKKERKVRNLNQLMGNKEMIKETMSRENGVIQNTSFICLSCFLKIQGEKSGNDGTKKVVGSKWGKL